MKKIIIVAFLFIYCKGEDIIVKDYLPNNDLQNKKLIFTMQKGISTGYIEKIKFENNCVNYYRKYNKFEVSNFTMKVGKTYTEKELNSKNSKVKNAYIKYKICYENNSLVYIDSHIKNIILTNKKKWQIVLKKVISKKYENISGICQIVNINKEKILGKVHKVIKTECDYNIYYKFADGLGIIETGLIPGILTIGTVEKLEKIK